MRNKEDLRNVLPLCYTKETEKEFRRHYKAYLMPFPAMQVWNAYIKVHPKDAWKGRRVNFSFLYNRDENSIAYAQDKCPDLAEGQLIFLEIKMARGLLKLAVTHQVNQINTEERRLKMCYVEGGKSRGSQIIQIEETGPNSCKVHHETYYKSDSDFRDKVLYPFFHTRIIDEFHKNMQSFLVREQHQDLPILSLGNL